MVPSKSVSTANKDITNTPSGASRGLNGTDGEQVGGVGSAYSAVLVQRENKSIPRDEPGGSPGANPGMLPLVGKGARRTGRL